ncbi:hypothetical protein OKA05_10595 [Luteolibacter arcticus]|uniref:Uncharacterized protein n=1 Tax=Luteolibacter arcticus TaxID=1581411 RepID=A0ABT3GHJ9_9BACT|nr:hypothetical protein [Luteolibacter arcticus]MCW1923001.1 hypothetical protein [Luteolibacter arcticus]
MSTQEKITQLAIAALRSAPPSAGTPKPVTFMRPFEKPRAVALVSGASDSRFEKSGGSACFQAAWPFARHEVWI